MGMKKWCTFETGYAGENSWFETLTAARNKAKSLLRSGDKRVVRIGKLKEGGMYRTDFKQYETWRMQAGALQKS